MTVKKGNKRIEMEMKEEIVIKLEKIAKILGISRNKFIKNAINKYIIDIFETFRSICDENGNINIKDESNIMICPICKENINTRGSVQHIKACKKHNEDNKQQHNPKIISKEKRDRLKKEKKFESIGRDGRMIEQL